MKSKAIDLRRQIVLNVPVQAIRYLTGWEDFTEEDFLNSVALADLEDLETFWEQWKKLQRKHRKPRNLEDYFYAITTKTTAFNK
jgi:hypothetical protein